MAKKYEKPKAQNLGDMLPSAQGICEPTGSLFGTGNPINCTYGNLPGNGTCSTGYQAKKGHCIAVGDGVTP